MADQDQTDVVIIGAGPAGAAAALFAGRAGLSACVIERTPRSTEGRSEWLNPAAATLLKDAGAQIDQAIAGSIRRVHFIDEVIGRSADATLDEPVMLVDVDRLASVLLLAAASAGALVERPADAVSVDTREDHVEITLRDQRRVSARLLIFADGTSPALPRPDRLLRDPSSVANTWCCESAGLGAGPARDDMTIFLNAQAPGSYGYAWQAGECVLAGVVAGAAESDARARFHKSLDRWQASGWVPAAAGSGEPRTRPVPRGLAMETETHVAKGAIAIGDAGGFVPALCHEGLYSAIESARAGIETCRSALAAPRTQEVLSEFDVLWRQSLAEHLRMPNTDLRFLIPLVFSNEQMAQRLAHAFLLGRNI